MAEKITNHLKPHTATLTQLFILGCQDAVSDVATAALKATSTYILNVGNSKEVMQLTSVIQPMLTVMNKCLAEEGEEDIVCDGLDVIQSCFDLEEPLINDHMEVKELSSPCIFSTQLIFIYIIYDILLLFR